MDEPKPESQTPSDAAVPAAEPLRRRRVRYAGKYPRRFEEKYKEREPAKYAETISKVLASGKTPAGSHRPIMVAEVMAALNPQPGEAAVDCTLGYGGHASEILQRIQPGGRLLGLDADPIELPKTEARLRAAGFGSEQFMVRRTNFAGLATALADIGWSSVNLLLADLGVSSMQLDDPSRGFSLKAEGPLDMRMNPNRGQPAAVLLRQLRPEILAKLLVENADEPYAQLIAAALAGQSFSTTRALAEGIRRAMVRVGDDTVELSIRRVFQALRIAVNDELSALDALMRQLPAVLAPGGRVAILTFHSGEDRRVKLAFQAGCRAGTYAEIAEEVIRPTPEERRDNPRSAPAKLRWARRTA